MNDPFGEDRPLLDSLLGYVERGDGVNTRAAKAILSERHEKSEREATWNMSMNRMGSMLGAVEVQAVSQERERLIAWFGAEPPVEAIGDEAIWAALTSYRRACLRAVRGEE